jgi:hypothetical protein
MPRTNRSDRWFGLRGVILGGPPEANPANWPKIRKYHEPSGLSLRAAATKIQVSERTLFRRLSKECWSDGRGNGSSDGSNIAESGSTTGSSAPECGSASGSSGVRKWQQQSHRH